MSDIECPFCKNKQTESIKNWKYGDVEVNRYECKCGKYFNSYKRGIKSWTIPKSKNNN